MLLLESEVVKLFLILSILLQVLGYERHIPWHIFSDDSSAYTIGVDLLTEIFKAFRELFHLLQLFACWILLPNSVLEIIFLLFRFIFFRLISCKLGHQ